MDKFILWSLYTALFFYCVNDAYQTKMLLDFGAYEFNPLVRWIMDVTGTWISMLLFKIFLLIGLGFLLLMKYKEPLHLDGKKA